MDLDNVFIKVKSLKYDFGRGVAGIVVEVKYGDYTFQIDHILNPGVDKNGRLIPVMKEEFISKVEERVREKLELRYALKDLEGLVSKKGSVKRIKLFEDTLPKVHRKRK